VCGVDRQQLGDPLVRLSGATEITAKGDTAADRGIEARSVLTRRPRCSVIFGSRSSRRKALRCSRVPPSSAPINLE
jgi:hypothetical protein